MGTHLLSKARCQSGSLRRVLHDGSLENTGRFRKPCLPRCGKFGVFRSFKNKTNQNERHLPFPRCLCAWRIWGSTVPCPGPCTTVVPDLSPCPAWTPGFFGDPNLSSLPAWTPGHVTGAFFPEKLCLGSVDTGCTVHTWPLSPVLVALRGVLQFTFLGAQKDHRGT